MSTTAYVLTGILVSWPPAAAAMWLTWFLARRKVAQVTREAVRGQNEFIAQVTSAQTRQLLGQPPAGPEDGPAGA